MFVFPCSPRHWASLQNHPRTPCTISRDRHRRWRTACFFYQAGSSWRMPGDNFRHRPRRGILAASVTVRRKTGRHPRSHLPRRRRQARLQPHQRNSCFNHELHSHWKTYLHLWKLHTLSITSENFLPINCVSLIFFTNHCRALKTFICKGPRVMYRSDKKGKIERRWLEMQIL